MTASNTGRLEAIKSIVSRNVREEFLYNSKKFKSQRISKYFACNTFDLNLINKHLSVNDSNVVKNFITSNSNLPLEIANKIADIVKNWAIENGATHYCHWFQPNTGNTAEKHDSFFDFDENRNPVESFKGINLIKSEPDASSFPSGGIRSTFEARGYTIWDASSPIFLVETDIGMTMCIPSVFVSYNGDVLDTKAPLLRSIKALNENSMKALDLIDYDGNKFALPYVGPEQEYFVIDKALYSLRPDLVLSKRALIGRTATRGQQLEEHYFGSIRSRILNFMMEAEHELYKLGVPCKTRHNEVAPGQCEIAAIFEQANIAADHNQLVMEVLPRIARKHDLVVLLNDKPFQDINGSGKHINWSIVTDTGNNLFQPGKSFIHNLSFLYFLVATINAVNESGSLIGAAIASPSNDIRLGGNEAPPSIISVYLGYELSKILNEIVTGEINLQNYKSDSKEINLDISKIPNIFKDNTDRNRTSPFAFTGNKFELRAQGASRSIAPAVTALNAAVAKSLSDMNSDLSQNLDKKIDKNTAVLKTIQKFAKKSKNVCFEGNNYSKDWEIESKNRGLFNLKNTPTALEVYKSEKLSNALISLGILTKKELDAIYNIRLERYNKIRIIELETLLDLLNNYVYPAIAKELKKEADLIKIYDNVLNSKLDVLLGSFKCSSKLLESLLNIIVQLKSFIASIDKIQNDKEKAHFIADKGIDIMNRAKNIADDVELKVDDEFWFLPKTYELLYII